MTLKALEKTSTVVLLLLLLVDERPRPNEGGVSRFLCRGSEGEKVVVSCRAKKKAKEREGDELRGEGYEGKAFEKRLDDLVGVCEERRANGESVSTLN